MDRYRVIRVLKCNIVHICLVMSCFKDDSDMTFGSVF